MNHRVLSALLLAAPMTVMADTSVTVGAVSDYLSYGVSQTDSNPAIQASLDWSASGLYLGLWGSNVDYGDAIDTNVEMDFTGGYIGNFSKNLTYKLGLAYYTYYGADYSNDNNYGELIGSLTFDSGTTVGVSYAWDYYGVDAAHYILALTQALDLGNGLTLKLGIDRSTSLDEDKYQWFGKSNYVHYFASINGSAAGFDLSLGVHGTDVDADQDTTDIADTAVLLTVARTFNF